MRQTLSSTKYVYCLEGRGSKLFSLDELWSIGKPFIEIGVKSEERESKEKVMNRLLEDATSVASYKDLGDKVTIYEVSDKVYKYINALGSFAATGKIPKGFWEKLARLPDEEFKKELDLLVLKLKLEPGWEL